MAGKKPVNDLNFSIWATNSSRISDASKEAWLFQKPDFPRKVPFLSVSVSGLVNGLPSVKLKWSPIRSENLKFSGSFNSAAASSEKWGTFTRKDVADIFFAWRSSNLGYVSEILRIIYSQNKLSRVKRPHLKLKPD